MSTTQQSANPDIAKQPRSRKKSLGKAVTFWVVYAIIVTILFGFESIGEMVENVPSLRPAAEHVLEWSSKYQRLAFVPRVLEPHYVALLSINAASEGPMPGPCLVREFISRLLPRIVDARPAIIASDIAFTEDQSSDVCPGNAPESKDLRSSITKAAILTPIILGQASTSLGQSTDEEAENLRQKGYTANMLVFRQRFSVSGPSIGFGVLRPNTDVRKVPLMWYGRDGRTSAYASEKSLALAVAETYRATFPDAGQRLKRMETSGFHPFAALLRETDFAVVPAIQVLCSGQHVRDRQWQNCAPGEGVAAQREKLRGRIVVIGFTDKRSDRWKTPVGTLDGYALHANYIEALLDSRTYRPVGLVWRIGISFVWFFVLELPFWLHGFSTVRALLLSGLVSALVLFLASYVALVNFGLYVGLFPPSLLLIAARVVHNFGEAALKTSEA